MTALPTRSKALARSGVEGAMRDASWYANPSGHGHHPRPPVYHVVAENGNGPACNPEGVLLALDTTEAAEDLPQDARCQRPACRKRWPKETGL